MESHEMEPLFSIVLHDIPGLKTCLQQIGYNGWVACSSEELLATKTDLFDIKVELSRYSHQNNTYGWPTITKSDGNPIRATQRDLYHYKALQTRVTSLFKDDGLSQRYEDDGESSEGASLGDASSGLMQGEDATEPDPSMYTVEGEASIVEPVSWAAIAYDSFIWWASAGERDADFREERNFDQDLLDATFSDVPPSSRHCSRRTSTKVNMIDSTDESGSFEASVVAYFHRITTVMLQALMEVAPSRSPGNNGNDTGDSSPGNNDQNDGAVLKDDLIKMGLDIWSPSDRVFVQGLARTYLETEVFVQSKSVECCGMRIL
ncbi:MAG: hypothetical protein Q9162_004649 [Coniocarpon cinnabarinum]